MTPQNDKLIVITPEERAIMETSPKREFGRNGNYAQFQVWLKQSSGKMMNSRRYCPETKEVIYEEILI